MKTVLTIAGFDPSSGAGVTADLMVFAAHGLFGTSCITALTVQSTLGVRRAEPIPGQTVRETFACLMEDLPPAGIKVGMIGTSDNVRVLCECLEGLRGTPEGRSIPVVLDPVIHASSGARLLDEPGVSMLRSRLIGLVDWLTPNVPELAMLTGREVSGPDTIPEACRALQARRGGRLGILAKGGHLEKPDDFLLTPGGEELWILGQRVSTRSTHGTGCALSSAFLSGLVLGHDAGSAAKLAKRYVEGALRDAKAIGRGAGPMNHLWSITQVKDTE